MASAQLNSVIGQLCRIIQQRNGCSLTDAQLLEKFVGRRDEASFEVLVWRHGTMVLSLCKRILHHSHDAEDAFQTVFLILARKAGSIGKRESVGSWLYKVAYRAAIRLRSKMLKHHPFEGLVDDLAAREDSDELAWRDLRPVLDEEIDRLPEKYRRPFVLCYLEGRTNEEAAEQLGCPKGTILSRLARGRERLRCRLTRRGVALSAAGMTALTQNVSAAGVPAALVNSTVQAAIPFAAGKAASALVSASVAALTEGVLHTMFLTKLKIAAAAILALAVIAPGAGLLAQRGQGERPAPGREKPKVERAGERKANAVPEGEKLLQTSGKVVALGQDNKSITLEFHAPGAARGDPPSRVEYQINDKTAITFSNVAADGAKLAEGLPARVSTTPMAKETAVSVHIDGNAKDLVRRSADLAGRVKLSPDGRVITFNIPERGRGAERVEAKTVDVQITDKTNVTYSYIAKGGAKPTEGYNAEVWFERGSKDLASHVSFSGFEERPPRVVVEKEPERVGRVVAAAADGKSFSVDVQPRNREDKAGKMEVKIDDKTKVAYRNVGANGDKPTESYFVRAWLVDGSQDTAYKVYFDGVTKEKYERIGGKVLSVAADGKGITVELPPPRDRRGGVAEKRDIKLTDQTNVIYQFVSLDGAKPTVGYFANVYLEEGSKDTAAQVAYSQPGRERRR